VAKAKGKKAPPEPKSEPSVAPPPRHTRRGGIEIAVGTVLVVIGFLITALTFKKAQAEGGEVVIAYGPVIVGFGVLARGAIDLSAPFDPKAKRQRDARRWIYGGIALVIAIVQMVCVIGVIPNRLPSAAQLLWTFPILTMAMALGTLSGHRMGWWVSVIAGGALMLSVMLVIVRILISAAFLAGVYGAFGKAAATFSFVAIALIAQVVALIPMFHIRWLMSRRGKRAYGV
jgi:hypothetical protein